MPFYDFNVWLLQVTLGVRLTGEVGLNVDDGGCSRSAIRRRSDEYRRRAPVFRAIQSAVVREVDVNGTTVSDNDPQTAAVRHYDDDSVERSLFPSIYNAINVGRRLITLKPDARIRASGEATGKVMVARAGINIGGDFNYWANLRLARDGHVDANADSVDSSVDVKANNDGDVDGERAMCITATNGYRPMSVNVASWYQMWDVACDVR